MDVTILKAFLDDILVYLEGKSTNKLLSLGLAAVKYVVDDPDVLAWIEKYVATKGLAGRVK